MVEINFSDLVEMTTLDERAELVIQPSDRNPERISASNLVNNHSLFQVFSGIAANSSALSVLGDITPVPSEFMGAYVQFYFRLEHTNYLDVFRHGVSFQVAVSIVSSVASESTTVTTNIPVGPNSDLTTDENGLIRLVIPENITRIFIQARAVGGDKTTTGYNFNLGVRAHSVIGPEIATVPSAPSTPSVESDHYHLVEFDGTVAANGVALIPALDPLPSWMIGSRIEVYYRLTINNIPQAANGTEFTINLHERFNVSGGGSIGTFSNNVSTTLNTSLSPTYELFHVVPTSDSLTGLEIRTINGANVELSFSLEAHFHVATALASGSSSPSPSFPDRYLRADFDYEVSSDADVDINAQGLLVPEWMQNEYVDFVARFHYVNPNDFRLTHNFVIIVRDSAGNLVISSFGTILFDIQRANNEVPILSFALEIPENAHAIFLTGISSSFPSDASPIDVSAELRAAPSAGIETDFTLTPARTNQLHGGAGQTQQANELDSSDDDTHYLRREYVGETNPDTIEGSIDIIPSWMLDTPVSIYYRLKVPEVVAANDGLSVGIQASIVSADTPDINTFVNISLEQGEDYVGEGSFEVTVPSDVERIDFRLNHQGSNHFLFNLEVHIHTIVGVQQNARLSAIEATNTQQTTDIGALTTRVTTAEADVAILAATTTPAVNYVNDHSRTFTDEHVFTIATVEPNHFTFTAPAWTAQNNIAYSLYVRVTHEAANSSVLADISGLGRTSHRIHTREPGVHNYHFTGFFDVSDAPITRTYTVRALALVNISPVHVETKLTMFVDSNGENNYIIRTVDFGENPFVLDLSAHDILPEEQRVDLTTDFLEYVTIGIAESNSDPIQYFTFPCTGLGEIPTMVRGLAETFGGDIIIRYNTDQVINKYYAYQYRKYFNGAGIDNYRLFRFIKADHATENVIYGIQCPFGHGTHAPRLYYLEMIYRNSRS